MDTKGLCRRTRSKMALSMAASGLMTSALSTILYSPRGFDSFFSGMRKDDDIVTDVLRRLNGSSIS
jgi:hypothetical protein